MEFLLLLSIPLAGALTLGIFGARRWAPEANALVSLGTFAAACMLAARVISAGPFTAADEQFFIDPFNVFLVTLTAFVSLTTSLFSRPYMRIEREHGRVGPVQLRLYHSMYQLFITAMLVALTTNNMGLMWVAMEAATLSTVLLVTLYRTPASLEAGWKYFILCGVGIAQALFGTILLYFASEKVLGAEGMSALLWTHLNGVKGQLEPTVLSLAFVFLLVGYGTKVDSHRCTTGCPTRTLKARLRFPPCSPDYFSNVAIYAVIRCKVLVEGALDSALPSQMLMGFGLGFRGARRVFPLAAARYQTPVRLLVDRAYGNHRVCVRHGRPGGEFRRPAAHDGAFVDEVRHLLRRRSRRAESRHADHG